MNTWRKSGGLPAEFLADEVVVGLERLCADSCVDFGHHSALIHDGRVQHCGVQDCTTKHGLITQTGNALVHQVNPPQQVVLLEGTADVMNYSRSPKQPK